MFQVHVSELARLGRTDLTRPELNKIYSQKKQEMDKFDANVRLVLEKYFQPGQFRSVTAILTSIPTGNLDFIFQSWLSELAGLNALTQSQVDEINEQVKL